MCTGLGEGGESLAQHWAPSYCNLLEYNPWSQGPGKPCSIHPALFPRLSWLSVAVRLKRKTLLGGATFLQTCTIAKQTGAAVWSQQAHCLTHGKTSHDFSVTGHFKSSRKCPLAINVMQIFLRTHLLMRGPWK